MYTTVLIKSLFDFLSLLFLTVTVCMCFCLFYVKNKKNVYNTILQDKTVVFKAGRMLFKTLLLLYVIKLYNVQCESLVTLS